MTGKEWVYYTVVNELLENQKKEFVANLNELLGLGITECQCDFLDKTNKLIEKYGEEKIDNHHD